MTRNGNALRLLAYAFAAVDHGSLRQAARALRVRESSVSRNVLKLEQLLEMQLFERDFRGVRLTEAGRAWANVARARYDGLLDALMECAHDNKDANTLRIGLCWVAGGAFLRRLIDRFGSRYPDVSLAIEDIPAGECLSAVRRRRLDIVFTHSLGPVTACRSEVFWQERLFVLLPPHHPLIDKPVVAWSDLADMQLLVPAELGEPRLGMHRLERIATDGGPAIQFCRANRTTIFLKVQIGQGITLAEESYARAFAINTAMWKPLVGQNSVSSIGAVWLDSNPKRFVLRLVAMARNMAAATPSPGWSMHTGIAAGNMLT